MITTPRELSSMASYNVTKFTRQVLKRNRHGPPSLVLHLYPTYFRFEQQVRQCD
jgi:hypothetical protein